MLYKKGKAMGKKRDDMSANWTFFIFHIFSLEEERANGML